MILCQVHFHLITVTSCKEHCSWMSGAVTTCLVGWYGHPMVDINIQRSHLMRSRRSAAKEINIIRIIKKEDLQLKQL